MSIKQSKTECKYNLFTDIPKKEKGKKLKPYKLLKPDYCPVCDCESYLTKANIRLCTRCGTKW